MEYYSVWEHGNSAKVENPESCDSIMNYGWGTDILLKTADYDSTGWGRHPCWFHIPIPVNLPTFPLLNTYLLSVQILFSAKNLNIIQVDVYDGPKIIHSENHGYGPGTELWTDGVHYKKEHKIEIIETKNWRRTNPTHGGSFSVIALDKPHLVYCGIGISFLAHVFYREKTRYSGEEFKSRLIIASAGANFKTITKEDIFLSRYA